MSEIQVKRYGNAMKRIERKVSLDAIPFSFSLSFSKAFLLEEDGGHKFLSRGVESGKFRRGMAQINQTGTNSNC